MPAVVPPARLPRHRAGAEAGTSTLLATLCHRPGCLHRQEPGSGVRQAVQTGQLARRRYDQYLQLVHHLWLA